LKALPTLTIHGFITDESLLMSKLYEYFLTTQHSQSLLYNYYINSYDKIIKDSPTVSKDVVNGLEEALYKLYDEYFTNIEPTVRLEEKDDNDKSVYKLYIEIDCIGASGEKLSLSKVLTTTNGSITGLTKIIDYFKG